MRRNLNSLAYSPRAAETYAQRVMLERAARAAIATRVPFAWSALVAAMACGAIVALVLL